MKAVIVAAGRGNRMMPLTADTPKPLLLLHGRPILEHILLGLKDAGVKDVLIVVKYLGEKIAEYFGDGSKLGMRVSYVEQTGPMGTGSALLSAEPWVGDEPFMLLWGDVLMESHNYRRLRELYARYPCDLISSLNWMDDPCAGSSNEVEGDRIVRIVEKPAPGTAKSNWNQAGLFVCTTAVIEAMKVCGLSPRGEIEFTAGVELLLGQGKDVRWMPVQGFWSDVGTPEILAALEASDLT
ncbi:MAG: NTP transferase domain-containing protein [Armatimonadetes bacterium]|nr:NTP transferase domain-containing protein [Armatimonadota bacterium]